MNRGYITGANSQAVLNNCKPIIQDLHREAQIIANTRKLYCPDWSVVDGLRTAEQQHALFKIGRELQGNGEWVIINPDEIRTHCDGYKLKSVHQSGLAIDICPYIDGKSSNSIDALNSIVTCYFEGASGLDINIDWGGSFRSISDAFHIEVTSYEF